MNSILWIASHWSNILEAAGEIVTTISVIVALLPQSASKNKVVAVLERVSFLTHRDSPGTLKAPGSSSVRTVLPAGAE